MRDPRLETVLLGIALYAHKKRIWTIQLQLKLHSLSLNCKLIHCQFTISICLTSLFKIKELHKIKACKKAASLDGCRLTGLRLTASAFEFWARADFDIFRQGVEGSVRGVGKNRNFMKLTRRRCALPSEREPSTINGNSAAGEHFSGHSFRKLKFRARPQKIVYKIS